MTMLTGRSFNPFFRALRPLLLTGTLAMLPLCARAAAEPDAKRADTPSVSVSLDGSLDRYGESRTEYLRGGLGADFGPGLKLGAAAFDWKLEAYYSYSRYESPGYASTADSLGLDLARIQLSRWGEKEFETFKPYLLAGAELSWLKENTEDDDGEYSTSSKFLSPVAGAGAELKLGAKTGLTVEYRSNLAGGGRRLSGLTLGLTYTLFGAKEEEPEEDGTEGGAD